MNTYRISIIRNWKTEIVTVKATSRKYAEGQVKQSHKGASIESCVKVGCKPVKVAPLVVRERVVIEDELQRKLDELVANS